MSLTRRISICLISIVFSAFAALANEPLPGEIELENGEVLSGFVSYRKLDVPSRILFYELDSILKQPIEESKTIYGPNELKSFTYGDEKWYSLAFTKKELGYQASYFLKVLDTTATFALLGGIVTGEGCNCSGTKINATYHWLLLETSSKERLILSKKRHAKIEKPEWVSAFFSTYGIDVLPSEFKKPRQVLKPIKEGNL